MRNARTVSKCSGTQVIVVESRFSAVGHDQRRFRRHPGADVSAGQEQRVGTAVRYNERPERSSPPNARRSGNSVGSVIGPWSGIRVICESPSERSRSTTRYHPATRPCAENCPRSPSKVASTVWRRSARDNIVVLRAAVRWSVPSAGTSEHEDVLDAYRVGKGVDGRRGIADLLAADREPIEQSARRYRPSPRGEARAGGAEHLALHEPPERQHPRGEDGDHPGTAIHETARCSAASNTC